MPEDVPNATTESTPENESPTTLTSEKPIVQETVVPPKSPAKILKMKKKARKKISRHSKGNTVWITGSRKWKHGAPIKKILNKLNFSNVDFIVIGNRSGAEAIGQRVARALQFNLVVVSTNILRFGDSAEAIRDEFIIRQFQPKLVLAFYEKLEEDGGRYDNLPRACRLAKKKGIDFQIIKK